MCSVGVTVPSFLAGFLHQPASTPGSVEHRPGGWPGFGGGHGRGLSCWLEPRLLLSVHLDCRHWVRGGSGTEGTFPVSSRVRPHSVSCTQPADGTLEGELGGGGGTHQLTCQGLHGGWKGQHLKFQFQSTPISLKAHPSPCLGRSQWESRHALVHLPSHPREKPHAAGEAGQPGGPDGGETSPVRGSEDAPCKNGISISVEKTEAQTH